VQNLRSPLKNAEGLGSSPDGVLHHWIAQRISAVALVPLSLWFVYVLTCHFFQHGPGVPLDATLEWFDSALHCTLLFLFMVVQFYHGYLGLQVVIEDYVHSHFLKYTSLIFLKLSIVFLTVLLTFILFKLYLGL
jgi:succinate dehydrogenase / fumarate reductase, membrane anchor subunit